MRTKVRLSIFLAVVAVFAAYAVNSGTSKNDEQRNCGTGVRSRIVVAFVVFKGGHVNVHGHIGPKSFNESSVRKSPFKISAQACPGETASITGQAVRGPLPSLTCRMTTGGAEISGDSMWRETSLGRRVLCRTVIK